MYRCTNLPIWQRKRPGKHDLCKFPHRTCSLPALENYEFCIKHILEDKTAPFKTCGYVYSINGKKCNRPAPDPQLVDRKEGGFCAEHTRKAQVTRQRAGGRHCPPQTVESLLTSLSHYASNNTVACLSNEMEVDNDSYTKAVNPFVELDASKINVSADRILEYVSESDSDIEPATLEYVWRDNDRDSSDAESVDSQQEDPLKHAGVYTAEEAALIVKEKMFRLQTLYYDQFKRLQHVLKERKRRYYHAFLKEKDAISKNNMTTILEQSKTSSKELKLYEKLKALNQFHRRCGEEGILHMRVREKRNQAKKMKKFRNKSRISDGKNEGLSPSPASTCKCIYTEGGVKCGLKTLPSSKYCRKHILEDSNQKLFRPCGCEKADVLCQEPVLNVFGNANCPLHVSLPVLPHLNVEIEDKKEEKGAGDVKYEGDNIPESSEETSTAGPGGDVSQAQNVTDKENEKSEEKSGVEGAETDANCEEKSTNDSVMDDIMANVDVVEEIVSQNENEQSSQPSEKCVMDSDNNSVTEANDNDNSNLSLHTSEEVSSNIT